jgi:hypothetical protein
MAEHGEAKSAQRSFASKYLEFLFLAQSFAQPFLAKLKWPANWALYLQGLKAPE